MLIIDQNYIHYKQAAEVLKLSAESVRRYIHGEKIEAEEAAGTWYIHRDEVTRFARDRKPRGRQKKK